MRYSHFIKTIQASDVSTRIRSYDHLIEQMTDGSIRIDGERAEVTSLEEAKAFIKQAHEAQKLEEQVSKDTYEELSNNTIATFIKEHHNIKVTDTLIESYKQFASSNIFTVDPVVQKIRSLNRLDQLVEGKIQYVLDDSNIVAISESTQEILNNLLQNQTEIIEHMRESKENFMSVLIKLGEQ